MQKNILKNGLTTYSRRKNVVIHGTWLNIAECELNSLAILQALSKRCVNSVDLLNEILFD